MMCVRVNVCGARAKIGPEIGRQTARHLNRNRNETNQGSNVIE